MGLDVSHDCFSAPYSAFMRFRINLAILAGLPPLQSMEGFSRSREGIKWEPYENDPICILLNHSDCDGEIKHKDCLPLADRLEELKTKIESKLEPDIASEISERIDQFVDGLRFAHEKGDDVEFS